DAGSTAPLNGGDGDTTGGDGDTTAPPPSSVDYGDSDGGVPSTAQPGGNSGNVTSGDAGANLNLNNLGGLLGKPGGPTVDAGTPDVGAGGMCQGLVCFDVFDCALWHPKEATTCGFTACEAFTCK